MLWCVYMLVMFLNDAVVFFVDVLMMWWQCVGYVFVMRWERFGMYWKCVGYYVYMIWSIKSRLCVGGGFCLFALFAVVQVAKPWTRNATCVAWMLTMSSFMVVGWCIGQYGCARFAWDGHRCRERKLLQRSGVILCGAILIICVSDALICFDVFIFWLCVWTLWW